jgi:hypothetical protein
MSDNPYLDIIFDIFIFYIHLNPSIVIIIWINNNNSLNKIAMINLG